MQRVRRLATLAVVTALGLTALAGCRADPAVAAYVGGTRITQEQVTAIVDDAHARQRELAGRGPAPGEPPAPTPAPTPTASPTAVPPPVTAQQVLDLLVSLDLGKRVVEAKGWKVEQSIGAADVGGALRLSPDAEYVKKWAEWANVQSALQTNSKPVAPDDEALLDLFKALVVKDLVPAGSTLEQLRAELSSAEVLQRGVAVRDALASEAQRTNIEVNPRYDQVKAPLFAATQQGAVFYDLPFVKSETVRDRA